MGHPPYAKSAQSKRMRLIMRDEVIPAIVHIFENSKFDKSKTRSLRPEEKETLVIHVRGGDIMDPQRSHAGFHQAPASLAEKTIEEGGYKRVILCAEPPLNVSEINPVHRSIKTFCANRGIECHADHRGMVEDMYLILNASSVLIMGHTSFSRSLVIGSSVIENIYAPYFGNQYDSLAYTFRDVRDVRVRIYELRNYLDVRAEWNPSEEMKVRMTSHRSEDVFLKAIL